VAVIFEILRPVAIAAAGRAIATLNIWGTIVVVATAGFALFWVRSRFRLTYGVIEFAVGFITTVHVFWPDFDYKKVDAVAALQVLGGLYIIVRGLDNIGFGLQRTPFQDTWNKVFAQQ
jgi:hypothetical protein